MRQHEAMQNFVEDIRTRCDRVGVKPEAVLQEAGLHRATWFRWASGASSPRLKALELVQSRLSELEGKVAA